MVIVMANTGNVNTPEKHFVAFEVALVFTYDVYFQGVLRVSLTSLTR